MPRFFLKLQEINNKTISFDELQSKKMRKVLRMKVGDMVRAFDGKGWEYEAQLIKLTNNYSLAKIVDQKLHERKSNITIIQALPKNLKIEFILQKCTELGVDRLIFFESEFSQVDATGINKEKLKRWRKIVQEASEQCGRIFVPEVELFTGDLNSLINKVIEFNSEEAQNLFYLDISGKFINEESLKINPQFVTAFIGPEGGFSPREKGLFDEVKVKKVKLHENVLRSETAGMVLLAQLAIKQ